MNYYIFNNRLYLIDESKATPGVCPHCDSKLAYNAEYCGKCGYRSPFYDKTIKVERKTIPCPTCGDTLHIDMEKCNTCGRINLSMLPDSRRNPPKKEDGYRYCWYCKNYVEPVHYCPICGTRCIGLDLAEDKTAKNDLTHTDVKVTNEQMRQNLYIQSVLDMPMEQRHAHLVLEAKMNARAINPNDTYTGKERYVEFTEEQLKKADELIEFLYTVY